MNSPNISKGTVPAKSAGENSRQNRNFFLLIFYLVFQRIGWIFKTESIIMPAVLDFVGGAGWLRGCLPLLNRFGQSIPPLLLSDRIKHSRLKTRWLLVTTGFMATCFFVLAIVFAWEPAGSAWMPFFFLAMYGLFFCSLGVNQLLLNTTTGKLVRFDLRGRMSLIGTVIGASVAVSAAWILLNWWLPDSTKSEGADPNFSAIFAVTGAGFLVAATAVFFLQEEHDHVEGKTRKLGQLFRSSIQIIKLDSNFRKLAIIAALFGMYLLIFPHYQRLARDRLNLSLSSLVPWVIAQNLGAAFFSIPGGWIADRLGNRLVLKLAMFLLCLAPITSLVIVHFDIGGWYGFTFVFWLLGLTPITIRFFNYYTLEICENSEHPRYLSTLNLAISIPPIFLGPVAGALVDQISFEAVFGFVIVTTMVGWILTFQLEEPRIKRD
ncbi:MAG: MFS transporter [Planctomycetota bacterium]